MAVIFYSNLIDFFSPKYSQNTLPIHYNDSKEKKFKSTDTAPAIYCNSERSATHL